MKKYTKKKEEEIVPTKCIIEDTVKYTSDKKNKMIGRTTVYI